ncbi:MAG: hypothetical protein MI739_10335 [Bacteroidales bacterium]|nr:hypothetical protein [Bacteroidales bacterium]
MIFVFLFNVLFVKAQIQPDTILFIPDFFDKQQALELQLMFDFKKFQKQKSKSEYLPAKLSYYLNNNRVEKNIRIKARGDSRLRVCFIPPMWINIKNSEINNDYIANSKKIKLVTICKKDKLHEHYLMREYLAYKLYNIITDISFRVRLVDLTIVDTGRKNSTHNEKAFILEPEMFVAQRNNALPIKFNHFSSQHIDSLAADIMYLFQYMIGNTDLAVRKRHNLKLIKHTDLSKPMLLPVPYDFDFSGLVNTYYAAPAEPIDIKEVTQRYYVGPFRSDQQHKKVIQIFLDKKNKILSYIDTCRFLDKRSRKWTSYYIKDFYKEIENKKFLKRLKSE